MLPRYDYKCTGCGFIKEYRHRMTENPEIFCPECGIIMKKALLSPPEFIEVGGNWPDKMRRRGDIKYDPPMDR